jgi:hypothetical protein
MTRAEKDRNRVDAATSDDDGKGERVTTTIGALAYEPAATTVAKAHAALTKPSV